MDFEFKPYMSRMKIFKIRAGHFEVFVRRTTRNALSLLLTPKLNTVLERDILSY